MLFKIVLLLSWTSTAFNRLTCVQLFQRVRPTTKFSNLHKGVIWAYPLFSTTNKIGTESKQPYSLTHRRCLPSSISQKNQRYSSTIFNFFQGQFQLTCSAPESRWNKVLVVQMLTATYTLADSRSKYYFSWVLYIITVCQIMSVPARLENNISFYLLRKWLQLHRLPAQCRCG